MLKSFHFFTQPELLELSVGKCYTVKIDSFQSKSFNVVFIKFGPYSDTLIIKRYFIADNYSEILQLE